LPRNGGDQIRVGDECMPLGDHRLEQHIDAHPSSEKVLSYERGPQQDPDDLMPPLAERTL
jgi:hypothetical protein